MSNYVYDGRTRSRKLTVDFKTSSGVSADGYPKVYLLTDPFVNPGPQNPTRGANPNEPPVNASFYRITNLQLSRMSEADFQSRLIGFYNYVESQNPGLDRSQHLVPGYEPTGQNATACPIGQEASDDPQIIV